MEYKIRHGELDALPSRPDSHGQTPPTQTENLTGAVLSFFSRFGWYNTPSNLNNTPSNLNNTPSNLNTHDHFNMAMEPTLVGGE